MAYNAKQSRIDRVSPSSFSQAKESCSDWFRHKWNLLKRHWAVHRIETRPQTVALHKATIHDTPKSVSNAQKSPKHTSKLVTNLYSLYYCCWPWRLASVQRTPSWVLVLSCKLHFLQFSSLCEKTLHLSESLLPS